MPPNVNNRVSFRLLGNTFDETVSRNSATKHSQTQRNTKQDENPFLIKFLVLDGSSWFLMGVLDSWFVYQCGRGDVRCEMPIICGWYRWHHLSLVNDRRNPRNTFDFRDSDETKPKSTKQFRHETKQQNQTKSAEHYVSRHPCLDVSEDDLMLLVGLPWHQPNPVPEVSWNFSSLVAVPPALTINDRWRHFAVILPISQIGIPIICCDDNHEMWSHVVCTVTKTFCLSILIDENTWRDFQVCRTKNFLKICTFWSNVHPFPMHLQVA